MVVVNPAALIVTWVDAIGREKLLLTVDPAESRA